MGVALHFYQENFAVRELELDQDVVVLHFPNYLLILTLSRLRLIIFNIYYILILIFIYIFKLSLFIYLFSICHLGLY